MHLWPNLKSESSFNKSGLVISNQSNLYSEAGNHNLINWINKKPTYTTFFLYLISTLSPQLLFTANNCVTAVEHILWVPDLYIYWLSSLEQYDLFSTNPAWVCEVLSSQQSFSCPNWILLQSGTLKVTFYENVLSSIQYGQKSSALINTMHQIKWLMRSTIAVITFNGGQCSP